MNRRGLVIFTLLLGAGLLALCLNALNVTARTASSQEPGCQIDDLAVVDPEFPTVVFTTTFWGGDPEAASWHEAFLEQNGLLQGPHGWKGEEGVEITPPFWVEWTGTITVTANIVGVSSTATCSNTFVLTQPSPPPPEGTVLFFPVVVSNWPPPPEPPPPGFCEGTTNYVWDPEHELQSWSPCGENIGVYRVTDPYPGGQTRDFRFWEGDSGAYNYATQFERGSVWFLPDWWTP
jgi:hypothetical protein